MKLIHLPDPPSPEEDFLLKEIRKIQERHRLELKQYVDRLVYLHSINLRRTAWLIEPGDEEKFKGFLP